ncbi:MAG: hypothetical protein IT311_03775 [Anaerolineales bacterium]|nr:hypothetical protein [Anaerolineales bacterium]
MSLVFAAILILWLMIILLSALTADKPNPAADSAKPASASESSFKAQAAASAVALALAEQELSGAHPLPDPPTAIVSAWQLGMRTSQRAEKGNFRGHWR